MARTSCASFHVRRPHCPHCDDHQPPRHRGLFTTTSVIGALLLRFYSQARDAIFLTNTELDEQRVKLQLNAADFPGAEKVVLRTGFGNGEPQETRMGSLEDETLTLTLKLPARTPVMLEIL